MLESLLLGVIDGLRLVELYVTPGLLMLLSKGLGDRLGVLTVVLVATLPELRLPDLENDDIIRLDVLGTSGFLKGLPFIWADFRGDPEVLNSSVFVLREFLALESGGLAFS
eukprot:NODE_114_length_19305_cov_0.149849.p12 type:complete len:111 gc:universal NODE_114_length_19305_cov_0.149849:17432-17100(-)